MRKLVPILVFIAGFYYGEPHYLFVLSCLSSVNVERGTENIFPIENRGLNRVARLRFKIRSIFGSMGFFLLHMRLAP